MTLQSLASLLLFSILAASCASTETASNLGASSLKGPGDSDGYVEIENLCERTANVRIDFLGNAGSKGFNLASSDLEAVYFGPNTAYICYTLDLNRPIRACQHRGPTIKAGAYIELCGSDEPEAAVPAVQSTKKRSTKK